MAVDAVQELIEAAHGVLPYLKASTDPYEPERDVSVLLEHINRSASYCLRQEAEEADKKDAAIIRFREALVSFAAAEGS